MSAEDVRTTKCETDDCEVGMSWIGEVLGTMAQPQTEIDGWRWQANTATDDWTLVIEGKRVSAQEQFKQARLAQCALDKEVQAEIVLGLQKIVALFSATALMHVSVDQY